MNMKKTILYLGLVIAGILIGWSFFGGESVPETHQQAETEATEAQIYTCSMHPSVRHEGPGSCPICGMDLIPLIQQTSDETSKLVMTEAAMKLAEIETTPVVLGKAVKTVVLPGKVAENDEMISNITALFSGRIRNLYVDSPGRYVKKGQKLASVYSPELVAAQQELLESAKYKDQNPVLYKAAKRKLALWFLPEETISKIETSGKIQDELDIVSPVSGFVTKLGISREDQVKEGTVMYRISDLSNVWVEFQVYESDIPALKKGDDIEFTVSSLPGETFRAKISYIDPYLNDVSRTAIVRAEVENTAQKLKPNMLAEGLVKASSDKEKKILIPKSAVMWTGKRSIAFVRVPNKEQPTFEARKIVLGERAGDQYVVESGLEEGEEVVSHGTFKLDSAAQLADKLSMMNQTPVKNVSETMPMVEDAKADTVIPALFQKQLKEAVKAYMELKGAFVASDAAKAQAAVGEFLKSLDKVDMTLLPMAPHMQWMAHLEIMKENAGQIESSSKLAVQRNYFMPLSDELVKAVKRFGIEGVVYYQFCPMADGGNGAYWLSEEEEIRNPYFGDMMLTCGEVVEIIE